MSALAFVLESAAVTVVFVKGSIFKRLRENGPELWREFAACPLCAGVWIGAGWLLVRRVLAGAALHADAAVDALAAGAITGVLSLGCVLLLAVLDKHT